jgi:hypothetical protein
MVESVGTTALEHVEKPDSTSEVDSRTAANLEASARSEVPTVLIEEADGVTDAGEVTVTPPKAAPEKQISEPAAKPAARPLAQKAVTLAATQKPSSPASTPPQESSVEPIKETVQSSGKPAPESTPVEVAKVAAPEAVKDEPKKVADSAPTVPKPTEAATPTSPKAPKPKAEEGDGGSGKPPAETLNTDAFDDGEDNNKNVGSSEGPTQLEAQVEDAKVAELVLPKEADTSDEPSEKDHELRDRLRRDHPSTDETNNWLKKSQAESVVHMAPEAVVKRVKELSSEMKETPFRSPTYLTCMYELAEQLRPHLAEYGTLIVSDTNSRLPALVFRNLINEARDAAGLAHVDIRFVNGLAGGNLQDYPGVTDFTTAEGRALIFSDAVIGRSSLDLHEALRQNNPDTGIDVAGVGDYRRESEWVQQQLGEDARVIVGNRSRGVPYLYPDINTLNRGVDRWPGAFEQRRHPANMYDSEAVVRARRDAAQVAEGFSELLGNLPAASERVAKKSLLKNLARRLKRSS